MVRHVDNVIHCATRANHTHSAITLIPHSCACIPPPPPPSHPYPKVPDQRFAMLSSPNGNQDASQARGRAGSFVSDSDTDTQSLEILRKAYNIRDTGDWRLEHLASRGSGADNSGNDGNDGVDAVRRLTSAATSARLRSRVRALGVPPRPLTMGSLTSSAGEPFSLYGYVQNNGQGGLGQSDSGAGVVASVWPTAPLAAQASTMAAAAAPPGNSAGGVVGGNPTPLHASWVGGKVMAAGWRPRGVLVSSMHEHSAAVNSISIAQDDSFMVTGSDDGTVKVRLTYVIGSFVGLLILPAL